MKRPDADVVEALQKVSKQYPNILTWLSEWRQEELERLPQVTNNTALAQGRCLVLGELVNLMKLSNP